MVVGVEDDELRRVLVQGRVGVVQDDLVLAGNLVEPVQLQQTLDDLASNVPSSVKQVKGATNFLVNLS